MKFFLLILKNLRRNKLRTFLTCIAVMVLVFVVTMIWTIVYFLDNLTNENKGNLKAIVTDRFEMRGKMPLSYVGPLSQGAAVRDEDTRPKASMAWQFYIGTLDPEKRTRDQLVVLCAMDVRLLPQKVDNKVVSKGMIDDLDPIERELVEKLAATRDGCLMGKKRLKALNKQVGERFKITGMQFTGIDLEFEVVGVLPPGSRWDENGFMNAEYLNAAIDAYKGPSNSRHPLHERRLDMFWVEVATSDEFPQIVHQINESPEFTSPPVQCQTFASLIANFLDSYSGFIWFIEWVLVPSSMFSMMLLIANAISLNVRERTKEMAILKVIGFRPSHLFVLVLGEALMLGMCSGLVAGGLIYGIANYVFGGIALPGSVPFPVPAQAIVWGVSVGGVTALVGSVLPAWTARSVRASEVFARVG
jgi:putative ABC transport system permease protein